jgi:hypothetical protein
MLEEQALNVDKNSKFTYKENGKVLGKVISVIEKFSFKISLPEVLLNILSAFAKQRKATTSFIMSVCLHGATWFPVKEFS